MNLELTIYKMYEVVLCVCVCINFNIIFNTKKNMFNWIIKRLLFGIQNILFIQSITWIKIKIIESYYFPLLLFNLYYQYQNRLYIEVNTHEIKQSN